MEPKTYTSVDPAPLTKVVSVVVYVHLAVALVYLGLNTLLLPAMQTRDMATLQVVSPIYMTWRLVTFVVNLVTAGFVLRWVWRTNRNAHAFARKRLEMSPAWAVLWFFVPVAALAKPFEGVEQTWRTSKDPWNPKRVATPGMLVWWWRLFVLATFLGQVAAVMGNNITLPGLTLSIQLNIAVGLMVIPLDLMFVKVARDLSKLQADQIAFGAFDDSPAPLGGGVAHAEG